MAVRTTFKTQLTDVDTSAKDVLGSLRCEGEKWYRYVKLINDTASVTVTGVNGDPVSYTDGGVANNEVTLDVTSADATDPILAGCLSLASGVTLAGTYNTTYYLWIQVTGLVTVPTAVTSGVIGSGAMTAAGDKTLTVTTGVRANRATLVTATAANNKVILHCL